MNASANWMPIQITTMFVRMLQGEIHNAQLPSTPRSPNAGCNPIPAKCSPSTCTGDKPTCRLPPSPPKPLSLTLPSIGVPNDRTLEFAICICISISHPDRCRDLGRPRIFLRNWEMGNGKLEIGSIGIGVSACRGRRSSGEIRVQLGRASFALVGDDRRV